MLDYYGSIIQIEQEIDKELIELFKKKCYESHIKNLIFKLRKEEVIHKEYSVSGWMMFHRDTIKDIINIELNYKKQKSEKKLKFLYCYNLLFRDYDICRSICDKL